MKVCIVYLIASICLSPTALRGLAYAIGTDNIDVAIQIAASLPNDPDPNQGLWKKCVAKWKGENIEKTVADRRKAKTTGGGKDLKAQIEELTKGAPKEFQDALAKPTPDLKEAYRVLMTDKDAANHKALAAIGVSADKIKAIDTAVELALKK